RRWENLLEGSSLKQLEANVLPRYLVRAKWFIPRDRNLYQVTVADWITSPLSDPAAPPVYWLLLEITGDDGIPGLYQLPVCMVREDAARRLAGNFPESLIANIRSEEGEGVLVDAFYTTEWQVALIERLANHKPSHSATAHVEFDGNGRVKKYMQEAAAVVPKIHTSDLYNTSIAFDNNLLLKFYRRIERSVNPDLELTRFLSKDAGFAFLPAFIGSIEWKDPHGCILLGMLQELIENHGDGYGYFLERINNYIERILAGEKRDATQTRPQPSPAASFQWEKLGSFAAPMAFEELAEPTQLLIGAHTADEARLIGLRTAEMHLALACATGKDLKPEPFSLHYQRSLFSSMQSLVRETYQTLTRNKAALPGDLRGRVERMEAYRPELLSTLKKIYARKLDAAKIRIHGNLGLRHILLTGKDIAINDYSGDPNLSFSERRIRRSPLVDLASMIASFHEVAFEGFLHNQQLHPEEAQRLLPMAAFWAHYISGFFIRAYRERVKGSALLPSSEADFELMLQYYVVQKATNIFNAYLKHDPTRLVIPMTMLRSVLRTPQDPGSKTPAAGGTPPVASSPAVS
ncbi:MAG TPA: alpha-amylase, partial [Puia sp.]|nr:alpha-amylase [Puia sp.]